MRLRYKQPQPNVVLLLGFAAIILAGGVVLALPVSLGRGVELDFIDSLFISASSVCVTGLATVDVGTTFSPFGQAVVALLVQTGGLGFATLATAFLLVLRRNPGFGAKGLLKEALSTFSGIDLRSLVRTVLLCAAVCEGLGAVAYLTQFAQDHEMERAIWLSVFTAISAFNNAGLDLFGGFRSLEDYASNPTVLLTTAALVVVGGLGFVVISDIIAKGRKMRFHSKIVLLTTAILIAAGTALVHLLGKGRTTLLGAFFLSVSSRTAGFATFDLGSLPDAALLAVMVLMFFGASPGSTGGGVKTTTLFALAIGIFSSTRKTEVRAFKRKISGDSLTKAFMVATLAFWIVVLGCFLIVLAEDGRFGFLQVAFETVSAFGTVGLSLGITPSLGAASKAVLIALMYIGRLGPLTFASLWKTKKARVDYLTEEVQIG